MPWMLARRKSWKGDKRRDERDDKNLVHGNRKFVFSSQEQFNGGSFAILMKLNEGNDNSLTHEPNVEEMNNRHAGLLPKKIASLGSKGKRPMIQINEKEVVSSR